MKELIVLLCWVTIVGSGLYWIFYGNNETPSNKETIEYIDSIAAIKSKIQRIDSSINILNITNKKLRKQLITQQNELDSVKNSLNDYSDDNLDSLIFAK